ncbi:MAG TPA: glycosyltransferase family 39 protein [Verrucomicrobiae bacterium]|nr:glycosyltransferase family 39 protein [Verrucomicrobiae bacterium]
MAKPTINEIKPIERNPVRALWRWVVFGLALLAVLFQLGARGLNEPDEGRYAEVGREMAVSGDWLVPRWDGLEHLSKPPVTYWAVAASLKLFGVNEFAARLPAALAALGTLLAVYLLARNAWGERAALWAVLVLLTSLEFFVAARLITTDMILTCFVTWSVWSFWNWYTSTDRRWSRLGWLYVWLGLAMVTKGPVGVVLPLFALLAVRWRNPRLRLRQMRWGRGAVVFLLIAAPWFVTLAWREPRLWHYFIVREVFERVATGRLGRNKEWWYFLPVMMAGMWPWTPLLLTLRRWREGTLIQRDFVRLCMGWAGLGLVLFTLSNSKLPTYVLPLYAPLAMLLGSVIARAKDHDDGHAAAGTRRYGLALIVSQLAVVVLAATIGHAECQLPWRAAGGLLGVTVVGGVTCAVLLARGRCATAAIAFAMTALAVLLACVMVTRPVERSLGAQTTAKFFGECVRREDPGNKSPVVLYNATLCGLPYYLERPVRLCPFHAPDKNREQELVVDFRGGPPAESVALKESQFRQLFAGPRRVFGVTAIRQVDQLRATWGQKLYLLERAGRWVLFSNQPTSS